MDAGVRKVLKTHAQQRSIPPHSPHPADPLPTFYSTHLRLNPFVSLCFSHIMAQWRVEFNQPGLLVEQQPNITTQVTTAHNNVQALRAARYAVVYSYVSYHHILLAVLSIYTYIHLRPPSTQTLL